VEPKEQVAFPMPWHCTVSGFCRPFADQRFWRDELLVLSSGAGPRDTQRAPGPQTCDQFAAKSATSLNVKRLINGLVGDSHRLIIREIEPESERDLLGTPRVRPTAILSASMAPSDPRDLWAGHDRPIGCADHA
jgi:hypothetical protein